jgi:hypothetical protein
MTTNTTIEQPKAAIIATEPAKHEGALAAGQTDRMPTHEGRGILTVIERAARDPNVDIDKLERLLSMKERLDAAEAERQFSAARAAAKAEIEPLAKNRLNKHNGAKYADLVALADSLDPIISKHGFSMSFWPEDSDRDGFERIGVELRHANGFSQSRSFHVPSDGIGLKGNANKTAVQSFGSTMSYGRRYAKLMIWDVATFDDNDGNAIRPRETVPAELTASQAKAIRELIQQTGTDEAKFLVAAKAESIEGIKPADFPRLEGLLKRKLAEAKAAKDAKKGEEA